MPPKASKGFTLIEVLVAITILVTSFSVIFPMFDQSGNQLARAERWQRKMSMEQNMLNQLSVINPMAQQFGRGEQGNTEYTWEATPISGPIPSRSEISGGGRFMLQMFRIDVSYRLGGKQQTLSFEQMGWNENP